MRSPLLRLRVKLAPFIRLKVKFWVRVWVGAPSSKVSLLRLHSLPGLRVVLPYSPQVSFFQVMSLMMKQVVVIRLATLLRFRVKFRECLGV